METKENEMPKEAFENINIPRGDFNGGTMLPFLTGLLYGMGTSGMKPSRKHEFQNLLLSMLKPCATLEEAENVISDMQEAVASTKQMLGAMIW